MPTAKPWRFRQIGGEQKILDLRGYAAPFGRPRQKAIVHKVLKVRQSKKLYPGNPRPTRHVWGDTYDDIVLEGRWMDNCIPAAGGVQGVNAAKAKVRECEEFIRDHQRIIVEWGDTIGMTGLITELDTGFESEAQATWKLTIEVDDDITRIKRPPTVTLNSTAAILIKQIPNDVAPLLAAPSILDKLQGLSNALLDAIDDQLSIATGAMGQFVIAANLITNVAQASEDELTRLRAGIEQGATAFTTLYELYESVDKSDETNAGGFLDVESASTLASPWTTDENALVQWSNFRLQQNIIINKILAELAELDAQAELAERGAATSMATADQGDTWESLALALYRDVNQATTLRAANGAEYGSLPVPGPIIVPPSG